MEANEVVEPSGSIDVVKPKEQKEQKRTISPIAIFVAPKISRYKLNLRRYDGQLRVDIPRGLLYDISLKWGDIIKAIPSNKWFTMDELAQLVWTQEKKNYLRSFNRSRKQIEDGITDLVTAGIVLNKET